MTPLSMIAAGSHPIFCMPGKRAEKTMVKRSHEGHIKASLCRSHTEVEQASEEDDGIAYGKAPPLVHAVGGLAIGPDLVHTELRRMCA